MEILRYRNWKGRKAMVLWMGKKSNLHTIKLQMSRNLSFDLESVFAFGPAWCIKMLGFNVVEDWGEHFKVLQRNFDTFNCLIDNGGVHIFRLCRLPPSKNRNIFIDTRIFCHNTPNSYPLSSYMSFLHAACKHHPLPSFSSLFQVVFQSGVPNESVQECLELFTSAYDA